MNDSILLPFLPTTSSSSPQYLPSSVSFSPVLGPAYSSRSPFFPFLKTFSLRGLLPSLHR